MVYLFLAFLLGACIYLIVEVNESIRKRRNDFWQEKIKTRDLGIVKWHLFLSQPLLNKKLNKLIEEAASSDSLDGNYRNFFTNEKHSELYKNKYKHYRYIVILKKAESDAFENVVSKDFSSDVNEKKIYQKAYVEAKSKIEQQSSSPWQDEGMSEPSEIIEDKVFQTLFAKKDKKQ